MRVERPRAARYRFNVPLLLTNLDTNRTTSARTINLSSFGCRIALETPAPSGVPAVPTGTRVRIRVNYRGEIFEAFGQVTSVRAGGGAGIVFTRVEPRHQSVLDGWIAALRNANAEENET